MATLAILLITLSAFTHASWNLICKAKAPSGAFFLILTDVSVILGMIPVLIVCPEYIVKAPAGVWWALLATGFFQAVYFVSLANAYRLSEISVAYPLARSIPVLLTPIVTFIFGFGKTPTCWALLGMFLIFCGCLVLPQKKFKEILNRKNYANAGFLCVICAALFITGYTVTDREGLRTLEEMLRLENGLSATEKLPSKLVFSSALFFITFEYLMISLFLTPYVLLVKTEREKLKSTMQNGLGYTLLATVLCSGGYMLVLCAMQLVDNVSYVVAFRQLSIPLGAVLGIYLLKENYNVCKISGL